jgi:type III secretory pathway component EscR
METKMFSEGAVASAKQYFSNKELINDYINEKVPTNSRKWDFENSNDYGCTDSGIPEGVSFSPKSCKPMLSSYYTSGTNSDFKIYAEIFNTIDIIIEYAKKETTNDGVTDGVMEVINDLRDDYRRYLNKYIEILDFFSNTIHNITSIIRHYSDSQNAFSFLNGKFIGINLKIILSYLHDSLGGDFYTVGICLCVVGCSLILSISSTIILIVIINIGLKEAQEQKTAMNNADTVISPYDVNNPGQNIPKAY